MSDTEQLLLSRITKLEQTVLHLTEKYTLWATLQREAYSKLVGGTEDLLNTPYDQSLLAKRQRKVRQP